MAVARRTLVFSTLAVLGAATISASFVAAAGGGPRQALPGTIVFERNDSAGSDIVAITPDGNREQRLTKAPGEDFAPSVGANGRIAFVSGRGRTFEIFTMSADGSEQRPVASTRRPQYQPSATADGKRIAFAAGPIGRSDLLETAVGGKPRLIKGANSDKDDAWPAWAPDGRTLAFASNRDGRYRLYVLRPGSTQPTPLTDGSEQALEPSWSPKGDRIAFTGLDDKGSYDIYTIPAEGGQATRVTDHPAQDIQPAWAPDGQTLAFASDRDAADDENWEIYVHTTDGKEQRVTHNPAPDLSPDWSPASVVKGLRSLAATPPPPLTCTKGTDAPDTLNGDGSDETICGKKGDDRIAGGGGKDTIYAGDGRDAAAGGGGNDTISGGVGVDTLNGGSGADVFYAQDSGGADTVNGGAGPPGTAKDRAATRDVADVLNSIET